MELEEIDQIRSVLLQHGYEYKCTIGKGGFSSVFLCHSQKYDFDFAIKRAHKNKLTTDEYNTLVSLIHPNIIRLYDSFEEESVQYLVMEYCPIGSIKGKGKLTFERFIFYSKQVLEALMYCHSLNIAHRDIKPENIFIDLNDNVRLADFGIAKHFEGADKSFEKVGSIQYFSPEMFENGEICPFKADIWALGVTFFCMATGSYPFRANTIGELKQNILACNFNFDKYDIDDRIKFLIIKMTQLNPDLRQTPEKMLKLPMYNPLIRPNISLPMMRKLSVKNKTIRQSYNNYSMPSKSKSRSLNFTSFLNGSSDDERARESSPLTKLHSYKSMSRLPPLQQTNCTFQPSKLIC